ncbi:MAG: Rid family detoxifying hydrolase [Candidatus Phosphoribacter sp.]|nr:RidA family protein [Actinomycetales bacterium]
MTRTAVDAPPAPAVVGPYSHAVRHGDLLFLSGQAPFHPETGTVVEGGIDAQTRQVFANLGAVLSSAGATFDDVLKANVYLTNLDDFQAVNVIYAEHFTEPYPARTTIGVAGLPLGIVVEIELVAAIPH